MQAIRRLLLIVPFSFMVICLVTQEQTDINRSLFITAEITFNSYTLNSFSERDDSTDPTSDNRRNDNTSLKVKIIQPVQLISELDADDLVSKPYVLSAL